MHSIIARDAPHVALVADYAHLAKVEHEGIVLGLASQLHCPQPSVVQIVSATGPQGFGGKVSANLTVLFGTEQSSAIEISGAVTNTIEFAEAPFPPSPPPPSPLVPPPMPPSSPAFSFTMGTSELSSSLSTNSVSGTERRMSLGGKNTPYFYISLPNSVASTDAWATTIKFHFVYPGDADPRMGLTDKSKGSGVRTWDQDVVAPVGWTHPASNQWGATSLTEGTQTTSWTRNSDNALVQLAFSFPQGTDTGSVVVNKRDGTQEQTYTGVTRPDTSNLFIVFISHNSEESYDMQLIELVDPVTGSVIGSMTGADLGN